MTPPNLSIIRDLEAEKYIYPAYTVEGCAEQRLCKHDVLCGFKAGFDTAIPYARAQGIEAVIDWILDEGYEDQISLTRLEKAFASDLAVLKGGEDG